MFLLSRTNKNKKQKLHFDQKYLLSQDHKICSRKSHKRVQIFGSGSLGKKSFFIDDLLCLTEQQGIALEEL